MTATTLRVGFRDVSDHASADREVDPSALSATRLLGISSRQRFSCPSSPLRPHLSITLPLCSRWLCGRANAGLRLRVPVFGHHGFASWIGFPLWLESLGCLCFETHVVSLEGTKSCERPISMNTLAVVARAAKRGNWRTWLFREPRANSRLISPERWQRGEPVAGGEVALSLPLREVTGLHVLRCRRATQAPTPGFSGFCGC